MYSLSEAVRQASVPLWGPAARTGSKTLLIESCGFFGGVASWSLGMPINQMRPESKASSVVHELLIQKLLNYGDQAVHIGEHQLYCNVDYLKVAVHS